MRRRGKAALLGALLALLALPGGARAAGEFAFVPGSVSATALNRDGTVDTQAGSHPFTYTVNFALETDGSGKTEGGEMRDIFIDVPPGLVGNLDAVPSCPRQSFEGGIPTCLPSTQVGILKVILPIGIGEAVGPLYNLTPPPGVAAQFGFSTPGFVSLQSLSVRSDEGYGVRASSTELPLEVLSGSATIWGVPADEGHTPERGPEATGGVKSEAPLLSFLTLPSSCGSPPQVTVRADSKSNPGQFIEETVPAISSGGKAQALTGCEVVPFSPKVLAAPTTSATDSNAGLDFQLNLPNEGRLNPKDGAVAETQPQKTEVTLPAGVSVNPSAANGIEGCSLAQYRAATISDPGCPEAAKLGTLDARTPLLEEAIEGSVYLAQPRNNPAGSFLGIYIIARVPQRGVLVKQFGEVRADPVKGQLTTTVSGLPPIPYSSFELRLREGPRAPLTTPALCGPYTTTARLYPFSNPTVATVRTAPFQITTGAGGSACAPSEAALPAHPTLEAGSLSTLAGAYSPFLFRVSRADGEQRFASIEAKLPPGLSGRLAGIPYCSEAQIAAARAREVEGGGAAELASPSCPQSSRVGAVDAAAGAGPAPYHVQGAAYLAGPYKGAPLSLAIVTPAVAGPFDLGAVTVRAGLYVNETTAEITAKSDPLPQILAGIPLDIRKVTLTADRSQFTLNPTNCEAMTVSGTIATTTGALAPLSNPFQVGGCRNLPYGPQLKLRFKGRARRTAHPKVIATLTAREGEANTRFAQVKLPRAAFLDQAHIKTVCTRVQFAAGEGNGAECPKGSIYGRATARTPLLDYPLPGTVYLRSSSHELPDLVVAFQGPPSQPIKFALAGVTDSVKGALRNTFHSAPDVPVESFRLELFGGKRGLVVLSSGLCKHRAALVRFKGHNGREYTARPKVRASCPKKGRKRHGARRRRG